MFFTPVYVQLLAQRISYFGLIHYNSMYFHALFNLHSAQNLL
jgi:hypothetical protein